MISKINKMNPVWKEKWIKALRSGDYEQTTGALTSIDENEHKCYCVLGVLAKIVADEHPEIEVRILHHRDLVPKASAVFYDESGTNLSGRIREITGVSEFQKVIVDDEECGEIAVELVSLNDDERLNFDKLADLIEAQL